MIQNFLKNNTTLVDPINTNLILPTQNKTDFTKSVCHEKGNKDLNLSRKTEMLETIALPNAKMKDPQEKKMETKIHRDIFLYLAIPW